MHEVSIVEALLDAVHRAVRAPAPARVKTVRIRVGQLRQVVPDTLRFCYEAATRDTPLAGSIIELTEVSARARCTACGHEFAVDDQWFICPACSAPGAQLLAGDELELTSIELTEEAAS